MSRISVRKSLVGILVLACVVRIAVMLLLHTWIFPTERAYGYEEGEIAYALANGQGFSWPQTSRPVGPPGGIAQYDHPVPTTFKAPISPAIIAGGFRLFGSYSNRAAVALELFQVALSALSCYVLFRLGRMIFNEWTGLIAALIFAVYPASIHFAVQKIEYPTLLTLLGLLLVHQTLVVSKHPSMTGHLALGALAGIALLVNPVILGFYPFGLLWLLWRSPGEWRTRVKTAVVIVGCCGAMMAPWLIRNYLVFNRFVFIRSNFARELLRGNFPEESRTVGIEHATAAPAAKGRSDGQLGTQLNQRALSLVLAKPTLFLHHTAFRVKSYWTLLGDANGAIRWIVGSAYFSMLGLALIGIGLTLRRPLADLALIYLLTMPIPFYLTWASLGRFRFPVEPILILFAAYVITSVLSRLPIPFLKRIES